MKTVLTATIENKTFWLTEDRLATDIKFNAASYGDTRNAKRVADEENSCPSWQNFGIKWRVGFMMFQTSPDKPR